jgi:hypothetical protein
LQIFDKIPYRKIGRVALPPVPEGFTGLERFEVGVGKSDKVDAQRVQSSLDQFVLQQCQSA